MELSEYTRDTVEVYLRWQIASRRLESTWGRKKSDRPKSIDEVRAEAYLHVRMAA